MEFVVHAEDVRRAQPEWAPRHVDAELNEVLWARIASMSRLLLHGLAMGVTVRRTDLDAPSATIKTGAPVLTLAGSHLDLFLLMHGRAAVDVQIDGDEATVAQFRAAKLGV